MLGSLNKIWTVQLPLSVCPCVMFVYKGCGAPAYPQYNQYSSIYQHTVTIIPTICITFAASIVFTSKDAETKLIDFECVFCCICDIHQVKPSRTPSVVCILTHPVLKVRARGCSRHRLSKLRVDRTRTYVCTSSLPRAWHSAL